jgi:molybdenum cofactor cytidylyltransferase
VPAGRTTRAGGANKLLTLLNGRAVGRETVGTVIRLDFLPPLVVTGHQAEGVDAALLGLAHAPIHNADYSSGMASSLRAGLRAVPDEVTLVLVTLGDMPFVKPSTIDALTETAMRLSEARIFIPTFNGKRGHPVLWHRDMLASLTGIEGDRGGRDIINENQELVCDVPVDDPGILIDLDTPEALARFGIMAPEPPAS